MESSNFTAENNKNVTRSWNFWFIRLDLPVQVRKFKIQPFSGITGHTVFPDRSGARVAWTAWPFQVPSGKRSTWFVFKEISCANQIIRFRKACFTNVTRKFAKLKSSTYIVFCRYLGYSLKGTYIDSSNLLENCGRGLCLWDWTGHRFPLEEALFSIPLFEVGQKAANHVASMSDSDFC